MLKFYFYQMLNKNEYEREQGRREESGLFK